MLDWILGGVIILFLLIGLYKGLVREVLGFISLLLGLFLAFNYMGKLSGAILELIPSFPTWILPPISFLLIFSLVVLLGRLLAKTLTKILSWAMLGWLNRIGGALIGFFKGLILASLFAIVLGFFSGQITPLNEGIKKSKIYPLVLNIAPFTFDVITGMLPSETSALDDLKNNIPDFEIPQALDNLKYLQQLNIFTGSDADSTR
jgi:membrane protein required for colicin V production